MRPRAWPTRSLCTCSLAPRSYASDQDAQRVLREVSYQRTVTHPNLLPLLGTYFSRLSADLYLLCPLMALDLSQAVRAGRITSPVQRQSVIYQLACALGHMHASGVVHRDLKPPNILLSAECRVRLCDFGLARTLPPAASAAAPAASAPSPTPSPAPAPSPAAAPGPSEPIDIADGPAASTSATAADAAADALAAASVSRSPGSRWYRSPELLLGALTYDVAVDMWSFGCVVAELLCGRTLLLGSSTASQLHKISNLVGARPSPQTLAELKAESAAARALVENLPPIEPTRLAKLMPRAPAEGVDLCRELLQLRPADRLDAAAVLQHCVSPRPQPRPLFYPPPRIPHLTHLASSSQYLHSYVKGRADRTAYAAASLAPPTRPYVAPLSETTSRTAMECRAHLEAHLATPLVDPPTQAAEADEEDMGA